MQGVELCSTTQFSSKISIFSFKLVDFNIAYCKKNFCKYQKNAFLKKKILHFAFWKPKELKQKVLQIPLPSIKLFKFLIYKITIIYH